MPLPHIRGSLSSPDYVALECWSDDATKSTAARRPGRRRYETAGSGIPQATLISGLSVFGDDGRS